MNDLPAPFNVQAVVTKKTITLTWQWQAPESLPRFLHFGYEVLRNDGFSSIAAATTYSDFDLAFGAYSYRIRARGETKSRGKRLLHLSDWSEPAGARVQTACGRAPVVTLRVEPTQRSYSSVPALRLHLSGRVWVPEGCSLTRLAYHIETGAGINHSGPLQADARGRFDDYVEALGPDDELPGGEVGFTVTVLAEDEAGPVTSDAYTIHMALQNPYAPRD